MPIYEYVCPDCGREFEELVRNSREKIACPDCGKKKCKKQMSAGGFRCGAGISAPASLRGGGGACGGCAASSCDGCGSK